MKLKKKFYVKIAPEDIDDEGKFSGLGAVFGNIDSFGDIIEPGAFKRTIKNTKGKTKILWQHRSAEPIGIGMIHEVQKGLHVEGELNLDTQRGAEAFSDLKKQIVDGLSIGFDIIKKTTEGILRHLHELKLFEISVVTFPANELALVTGVKSMPQGMEEIQQIIENIVKAQGSTSQSGLCLRLNGLINESTDSASERNSVAMEIKSASNATDGLIGQVLSGEVMRPSNDVMKGFADVLGVSVNSLIALADNDIKGEGLDTVLATVSGLSDFKGSEGFSLTDSQREGIDSAIKSLESLRDHSKGTSDPRKHSDDPAPDGGLGSIAKALDELSSTAHEKASALETQEVK